MLVVYVLVVCCLHVGCVLFTCWLCVVYVLVVCCLHVGCVLFVLAVVCCLRVCVVFVRHMQSMQECPVVIADCNMFSVW